VLLLAVCLVRAIDNKCHGGRRGFSGKRSATNAENSKEACNEVRNDVKRARNTNTDRFLAGIEQGLTTPELPKITHVED
jgi:hypothetical protein